MARYDALPFPGEFPAEKERQLALLEKLTAWVRDAEPDLELHRTYLERDWKGANARLQQLWTRLDDGGN